jgi:hypothetical protein
MDDAASLGEAVDVAATPFIAPVLISPQAMDRIRTAGDMFEASASDFFGFECPLDTIRPVADFLICFRARYGTRALLAGPDWKAPHARQRAVWRRIQEFAREWTGNRTALHEAIHNIWLEFDVGAEAQTGLLPNVFVGGRDMRLYASSLRGAPSLLNSVLPLLLGHALSRATQRQIADCVARLPSGARLFQAGVMLARPSTFVRLCIRGLSPLEILPFLEDVGWSGDSERLRSVVTTYAPAARRVDLDLDVADGIEPGVGLEWTTVATREAHRELLRRLVARNLCSSEKAAALLAWPGLARSANSTVTTGPESWYVRELHHVKVTIRADGASNAKAYLAVYRTWLPPERVAELLGPAGDANAAGLLSSSAYHRTARGPAVVPNMG